MIIKAEDEDLEIDMSPMIDMVFLLLIFFIVTASQLNPEKPLVAVPVSTAAKVAKDITSRLMVSIRQDHTIYVDMQLVTVAELKARLTSELEKDANLKVLIRADEKVPYEVSKAVMVACSEVQANNLIYSAFEK
ncbi:MAG: biopolymer transporter ExbD [Kiritimatiellaceae bacterium]|nr:biopolymer transporter ExbD [Kiritimatiellaceae bacterium]